uniref:Uncharacterized protein MANES_08G058100 n=1 Tax=Rhizophora mucronata TaxID=61149 RepID=A0A2P2K6B2_RHIMU
MRKINNNKMKHNVNKTFCGKEPRKPLYLLCNNSITDIKRGIHRQGRNVPWLSYKGSKSKRKGQGSEHSLCVISSEI